MVYILKDMGTKSSDGYKVLIAIVTKCCKALNFVMSLFFFLKAINTVFTSYFYLAYSVRFIRCY